MEFFFFFKLPDVQYFFKKYFFNCCRTNWVLFDIAWCFRSARAIGWLTAAARRANQSAAAEELSAIRGTAQESFNREQREGAERSRQPFSLKTGTQWPIWVSFVPKGILHLISSSLTDYDKTMIPPFKGLRRRKRMYWM